MNEMKRRCGFGIILVICAMALVVSPPANAAELYPAEISFDVFGQGYTTDFQSAEAGYGLGVNAFATPNWGVGVEALTYEPEQGNVVDEANVSLIYRVVAGRSAPYFFGGGGYDFEKPDAAADEEKWKVHVGLGIEHRFHRHFGVFADARLSKRLDSEPAAAVGRAGVRLAF